MVFPSWRASLWRNHTRERGESKDEEFHPENSNLVLGPIAKPRWIYSCSKQLLDRVISAYGQQRGLDYTLFRPFNWVGPGLDNLHAEQEGSSRVVTQFLGHIARGEPIQLVGGGQQRRCFTDVSDGVNALMRIIANPNQCASGKIYNIGNPVNNLSIRELAELMLEVAEEFPEYAHNLSKVELIDVHAEAYYGNGYQDVESRVPWIDNTSHDLDWRPVVSIQDALRGILHANREDVAALSGEVSPAPVESALSSSSGEPRLRWGGENEAAIGSLPR